MLSWVTGIHVGEDVRSEFRVALSAVVSAGVSVGYGRPNGRFQKSVRSAQQDSGLEPHLVDLRDVGGRATGDAVGFVALAQQHRAKEYRIVKTVAFPPAQHGGGSRKDRRVLIWRLQLLVRQKVSKELRTFTVVVALPVSWVEIAHRSKPS